MSGAISLSSLPKNSRATHRLEVDEYTDTFNIALNIAISFANILYENRYAAIKTKHLYSDGQKCQRGERQ